MPDGVILTKAETDDVRLVEPATVTVSFNSNTPYARALDGI